MLAAQLQEKLNKLLRNKIFTAEEILKAHSSQYYIQNRLPDTVCFAESEEDVIKLVDFCIQYKIPIIPYGSGTSLEGHIVPVAGGVCLDLSKMDKVLELNVTDGYVIVEPGIAYNKLNEYLAPHGMHFPVEAGLGASIGGMVSTNASGAGAVDAGSMAKNVMSCDVVVYQNERALKIRLGTLSQKTSAGYNLLNLFIGSEGTLGIITKVCLKIRKNFAFNKTVCLQFDEIQEAVDFIVAIKGKVNCRRAELLDKLQTEACIAYSRISSLDKNKNTILIELAGNNDALNEELNILQDVLNKFHVKNPGIYADQKSAEEIWMMRKNAGPAAMAFLNKSTHGRATDICVPLSQLNKCIQKCYQHMKRLGLKAPLVAHIGDGNFHFSIPVNLDNENDVATVKEFIDCVVQEGINAKGTCTGEHGIGIGKKEYLRAEHGDSIFIMQEIKLALDPLLIFNPGKIIDVKR